MPPLPSPTCESTRSLQAPRMTCASWRVSSRVRATAESFSTFEASAKRRSILPSCWPIACCPSGVIGRVRTAEREVTYQADADALFRGLPIAVLVNRGTSGTAEWIAAALQDNHRAMIVGSPTYSATVATRGGIHPAVDVTSRVAVGDGSWSIELTTGYLERGDGRRLSSDASASRASNRFGSRRNADPNESHDRGQARSSGSGERARAAPAAANAEPRAEPRQ